MTALNLQDVEENDAIETEELDVVVVGSGFSGLGVAAQLDRAGFRSFRILESHDDVGGAWRDNTYPGCGCDIPSPLYSYSFDQKPDWSRLFASQPEILGYLKDFAHRRKLTDRIRFNERVDSAVWNADQQRWVTTTSAGTTYRSQFLIVAVGPLHHPIIPRLDGIEDFQGEVFHSAQWRHDVDLTGKRVAVVGTGASAIQFVPAIADEVAEMTVFQRTAPWILPKSDRELDSRYKFLSRWFPPYRWYQRARLFWIHEQRASGFVEDPAAMEKTARLAEAYLTRQVPDPELRAKLTPDYDIGCKRVLISSNWYRTLQRPNVDVVRGTVQRVNASTVVGDDGQERPADVIIYGTGFDTQNSVRIDIVGRNGVHLRDAWRDANESYLGTTVAGFPNMLTMVGPNSALGHNSQVFMIEAQTHYIIDLLKKMRRRNLAAVDVLTEVQQRFNAWLDGRMARTVWQRGGCRSYYQNSKTGRNTVLWPDTSVAFWKRTRVARLDDYAVEHHRELQ
ncbi:MAG: NAD(P)/FAD-dependent oxidoreductase [Comamonadaceae bacterium]|nr:MAG: NAD(P)/FAD-dependent oxidoreductase [Comamonadaceae bacterium]